MNLLRTRRGTERQRARKHETIDEAAARFWTKVDIGQPGECWPWLATYTMYGYGRFRFLARDEKAHRVSLILASEKDISPSNVVRHRCDNPACCNPHHLELGTQADNVRDMLDRGRHGGQRQVSCINGHALIGDNLTIRKRNGREHRVCVTCKRDQDRESIRRRRAVKGCAA